MAYINQDGKAKIAQALKPILAKYKVKGTLSINKHKSTITLKIKSSPIDFIGNYNAIQAKRVANPVLATKCMSVNPYWLHEQYDGIALQFLTEAVAALKANNWFDKSDIYYFHTAYYFGIEIGQWDQPYQIAA